jgi:hypothetical protein
MSPQGLPKPSLIPMPNNPFGWLLMLLALCYTACLLFFSKRKKFHFHLLLIAGFLWLIGIFFSSKNTSNQ